MKRLLILASLFFLGFAGKAQTIGSGVVNNCVGGFNVYYFSGGTVNSWTITGTYSNLTVAADKSNISFNWSGAYTGAKITVSYYSSSCPSSCSVSTATFNVSAQVTPAVTITPSTVSTSYGTAVTLTANPTNGGTPTYYWYLNGLVQSGNTNKYITSTLQNGDQVYVAMNSSLSCLSANPVNSNTVVPTITYSVTAPTVASVSIPFNTSTALTASGAGTNEVYRWYGLKSGGSYDYQGTSFTTPVLTDHKTYYVSKYNTSTLKESARVAQVVTLVVPAPDPPSISINTCGIKTLTRGTPPALIAWYWQGTNSTGTGSNSATTYTVTEATAQTYYLRARATTANIWSTSVGIEVTTDPVDLVVNSYQPQNPLIQATSSITFKPGVSVSSGNQLTARIFISQAECNDIYNWSEQIVYDQNEQPLGRSRIYSSALGQQLQSQSIDMATGKIWVQQPLYDRNNVPSASTLPAPISENNFVFKKKFVTNASGQPYSETDFDLPVVNNSAGELKNPKPVDNTKPNTLGWYYSTNNTFEPNTPTTSFPYSRSYTPEGPDPTVSTTAGPGDQYRMGSNHESVTERQTLLKSELSHYFALRPYFVSTPLPVSSVTATNLISNPDAANTTGYTANQNVTLSAVVQGTETYVKAVTNQNTSTPGVFPIGGTIAVSAGSTYTLKVKGYRSSAFPVSLYVQNATSGADLVFMKTFLPGGAVSEGWVETTFVVPTGCTAVKVGVLWAMNPFIGDSFFINAVSLNQVVNVETMTYGYKFISTDPDGKKSAVFTDGDGRTLASAIVTGTNTYDYWSYTYYNDMGQVVATVDPKGVNTASTAMPAFVTTFKYDHLGRLIETTSPDEGTSKFVYSLDGKIRFSENQEQRNASPYKRFSYTNYDYLGRLVEAGEYTCRTDVAGTPYLFQDHTTLSPASNSVLNIVENNFSNVVDTENLVTGLYTGISQKLDANRCTDYSFIKYDFQALDLNSLTPNTAPYNVQTNTFRQVTRTENATAKTWYSYDEFGQLLWTKQNINGLGVKTVNYTYDYLGNVTQVAYQQNQADKFYHHYSYDLDQRLTEVYTSLDGSSKTLRAKYLYYLHGPLKRVELMNGSIPIQGIDYIYSITGGLKAINSAESGRDPGGDGIANGANPGFPPDVFGETLHYHDNDYSATYNAGPQTIGGYTNQYGGLVKAQSWHNATDNNQTSRTYAFTYDGVNQLTSANFGNLQPGSPSIFVPGGSVFKEAVTGYDKNGNILSLLRKGKKDNVLGDYAYQYETNTNRLDRVNEQTGGALVTDFTYNTIGQMITQYENATGKTMKVAYNAYGLVKEVRDATNKLITSYGYDDAGNRVLQSSYDANGDLVKTIYSVHDAAGNVLATYEKLASNSAYTLIEVPVYGAGRIGLFKPALTTSTVFYEIIDHLGNVRSVIGNPDALTFLATLEDNGQVDINNPRVQEMAYFKNLSATAVQDNRMNKSQPTPAMPTPVYSAYLKWISGMSGQDSDQKSVGPAIGLSVQPGDKLDISVWEKFKKKASYSRSAITTSIASILGTSFVNTASGLETLAKAKAVFQGGMNYATSTGDGNGNDLTVLPFAYVYYLLYDRSFNLVTAGWKRVTTSGGFDAGAEALSAHEQLTIPTVTVNEPGYMYIFVANESENTEVWFDDLKIIHQRSNIVAGADYYPFGLAQEGREISREEYRYGYQGQYSEKDKTTGWNQFDLRMYDARFGRWISPDPYGQFASPYLAMGNNPTTNVDPDGGLCCSWAELLALAEQYAITAPRYTSAGVRAAAAMTPAMIAAAARGSGGLQIEFDLKVPELPMYGYDVPSYSDYDPGVTSMSDVSLQQPSTAQMFDAEVMEGRVHRDLQAEWQFQENIRKAREPWGKAATTMLLSAGAIEYIAGRAIYGLAATTFFRGSKAIEGVYSLTTTGGGYIGQSKNVLKRVISHFKGGGKLSNYKLNSSQFYPMKGSTKLEREVYEQYLILKNNPSLNIRNPMGGRMQQYQLMIHQVIKKYNLPL